MSIEEYLRKKLDEHAMFKDQIDGIMALVKADKESMASMTDRWNDDISGYDEMLLKMWWLTTCRYAVQWIDANKPKHWARPVFAKLCGE